MTSRQIPREGEGRSGGLVEKDVEKDICGCRTWTANTRAQTKQKDDADPAL